MHDVKRSREALLVGARERGTRLQGDGSRGGTGTHMMNQGKSNEERPSLAAFSRSIRN